MKIQFYNIDQPVNESLLRLMFHCYVQLYLNRRFKKSQMPILLIWIWSCQQFSGTDSALISLKFVCCWELVVIQMKGPCLFVVVAAPLHLPLTGGDGIRGWPAMVISSADLQYLHGGVWPQCAGHAVHHKLLAHSGGSGCLWCFYIGQLRLNLSDRGGASEFGVIQQGVWAAAPHPGCGQPHWSPSCR